MANNLFSRSVLTTWSFWAASSIFASIVLIQLAPRYTVWQSYYWTSAALFLAQWGAYSFYVIVLHHRFFSSMRHLPTVRDRNHFLFGQFPNIARETSGVPMRRWAETIPNDGIIRYLHLFNRERILVTGPKALTEVMNTRNYDFVKPELLRLGIGRIIGEGVLLAERDYHKHQRKALAPAFSFRHIKEMYSIFWSKAVEMARTIEKEELNKKTPNNEIEVGEWASRATLDIIGLGGMGQDFNALADPNTELNSTYRTIFAPNRQARLLGLVQFFLPTWIVSRLPIKRNDDIIAAAKVARDTSRRLIRQKKARLEKKEKMSPDIISIALESGVFDEELLVDNMMTFLAAGHETTASAMTWAIYLLCKHPEYQKRLREEVHSHITDLNATVNDTTIDSMPLLHAVCQETLRVYAPVPLTLRKADVDTVVCDTVIPRGTVLVLAPWATNFDKELWGPDAEDFNPERWMKPGQANTGGATSNYAFLTFLHGPRSCIGAKFAASEMACLLAAFVGKFEFALLKPDEEIEVRTGVTAKPEHGLHVTLKVVEDW